MYVSNYFRSFEFHSQDVKFSQNSHRIINSPEEVFVRSENTCWGGDQYYVFMNSNQKIFRYKTSKNFFFSHKSMRLLSGNRFWKTMLSSSGEYKYGNYLQTSINRNYVWFMQYKWWCIYDGLKVMNFKLFDENMKFDDLLLWINCEHTVQIKSFSIW